MKCLFSPKNNEITFRSEIKLINLTSVPFVNAVFFAKMRILKNRSRTDVSRRVGVSRNQVVWDSDHSFTFNAKKDSNTNLLESVNLKISIRKEERGGNAFTKVGFVIINLSCFAKLNDTPFVNNNNTTSIIHNNPNHQPLSNTNTAQLSTSKSQVYRDPINNVNAPKAGNQNNNGADSNQSANIHGISMIHRKYILEGYKDKERQDNSMLTVAICVNSLSNNQSFIVPTENKSNCILMEESTTNSGVVKKTSMKPEKGGEIVKDHSNQTHPPSNLAIVKIPSANQITETDQMNKTKMRPFAASTSTIIGHPIHATSQHHNKIQQHSRNSSSESSSIHFNQRPLSDINPKQQMPPIGSIIDFIKSTDEVLDIKLTSANNNFPNTTKPKSPASPTSVTSPSSFQMIGKPHKVQSTRNIPTDLVRQVLQTVPNINVDQCNDQTIIDR